MTADGQTFAYDDVLDANWHRKQYQSDALGRLRQVVEMEGDCGEWGYSCTAPYTTTWQVYATTRYEYDVTDNLVQVTDAAENVTEMTYDLLGRKTTMSDPDMGSGAMPTDALGTTRSATSIARTTRSTSAPASTTTR